MGKININPDINSEDLKEQIKNYRKSIKKLEDKQNKLVDWVNKLGIFVSKPFFTKITLFFTCKWLSTWKEWILIVIIFPFFIFT